MGCHLFEVSSRKYFSPSWIKKHICVLSAPTPFSERPSSVPADQNNKNQGSANQNPADLIFFERDPTPGSRKNWRCHLCGEYFHNRGNAMNHIEAKHISVLYSCEDCGKEFKSRNSWKTHKSVYHSSQQTANQPQDQSWSEQY